MRKYKGILAPARGTDVDSKGERSLAGVGIKPTWYVTSKLYQALAVTLGKFLTLSLHTRVLHKMEILPKVLLKTSYDDTCTYLTHGPLLPYISLGKDSLRCVWNGL